MSTCSHVLYLALTQDLQKYLPNQKSLFFPSNYAQVECDSWGRSQKAVASIALLKSILKKNQDDIGPATDAAALDLFIRMNDKCRDFAFDLWSLPEELIHVFTWAKTFVEKWVHPSSDRACFDPANWLSLCEFGPGASVHAAGNSFFHKIGSSRLSMTDPVLYSLYLESIRGMPSWVKAEKLRRDFFGRPTTVSGSKLCFVPKTTKISRTICTEPSLNMFVQKGLGAKLERLLSRSLGFDLQKQQFRNKRLARIGSKTGSLSTIDLSSASDTISRTFVNYLFPSDIVAWFDSCRSPCTTLPNGKVVELHMISSMGNAFTFPLQTLIFSAIALGVYKVLGVDFSRPSELCDGNLGVFGDDIIVRTECFDLMCRSLDAAGFIVNKDKSFSSGLFRESCGGDYYDGHNVRGVYSKTLKTTHAKYSLINRLNDWSANQGIPLASTISLLTSWVRFLPVPPWESDIAGVKVPLSMANVKRNSNGSFVYKRLEARAMALDMTDVKSGFHSKKFRVKANPEAILVAAVKGTLRNGLLNIRLDVLRPHYRFGVAPCWDYVDLEHSRLEGVGLDVWKQMSYVNFGSS
jgi:hypothetical protein